MNKSALEQLLSSYNWWMGLSTIAVAVGILGEYVAHFIFEKDARENKREMAVSILFGVLVLGGVVGEYIFASKLSQVAETLQQMADAEVAQANKDAAQANERAANAEKEAARLGKMAEDEKLARVKIEQQLAPRTLDGEQQKRIRGRLSGFAGTPFELAVSDTTEAAALMLTLDNLLRAAGWVYKPSENADFRTVYTLRNGEDAEQFLGNGVLIGLSKSLQAKYKRAAKALVSTLRDEGITTTDFILPDNDPSPNAIHVKIGNKQ
jgi:hypothetical protein